MDAWNHVREKTGVDLLSILEHTYEQNKNRKDEIINEFVNK